MTDQAEVTKSTNQFVPGVFRCAKCDFQLIQSNLNAVDGSVTARDDPGDKCPNDGSPMWRVSWQEYATQQVEGYERLLSEKTAEVERLREALAALIPSNIGSLHRDDFDDDMVIPVDMTVREIRLARAALKGDA